MSGVSIISMVVILTTVIGGFIFFLSLAMSRDKKK